MYCTHFLNPQQLYLPSNSNTIIQINCIHRDSNPEQRQQTKSQYSLKIVASAPRIQSSWRKLAAASVGMIRLG